LLLWWEGRVLVTWIIRSPSSLDGGSTCT
jgi:hypothetical protein